MRSYGDILYSMYANIVVGALSWHDLTGDLRQRWENFANELMDDGWEPWA